VALGYLHSPQDAEDAVSEAVEATWRKLKHLRDTEAHLHLRIFRNAVEKP
ncbi:MAG: hypothetical protein IKS44_07895, partial [Bacteroidales bacterium]|nr:hypothetical protein [Bacteroidales bacterium]